MEQVFLALGSNIGNRAEYLRKAVVLLTQKVGEVVEKSEVIETEAVGFDAPPFLNQVLAVRTTLSPMELLQVTQEIEKTLGRDHKTHYQDGVPIYHNRTIDIDILESDGGQIDMAHFFPPTFFICNPQRNGLHSGPSSALLPLQA